MLSFSLTDTFKSSDPYQINNLASPIKAVGGATPGAGAGLVASGVLSGLSTIAQGFINAQRLKNTYNFNEGMAALNKRMMQLSARVAIADIRKKAQSLFSSQRAGYAKAGFSFEGSPAIVAQESLKNASLDEIFTQINADYGVSIIDTNTAINKINMQSAQFDEYQGMFKSILAMSEKAYTNG